MILFFVYFLGLSLNREIYTPNEIINYFNQIVIDPQILDNIKNNVAIILNDFYAFYEISKNPPQPNFDNNYHNRVDLKKEINDIQTNNVSFYKFYQDFNKALTKTRDGHFYFDVFNTSMILRKFVFVSPIKLNIADINGTIKVIGINNIKEEYQKKFKNYEIIFKLISKNENTPIKSINGKDPFNFISDFGSNYMDFRSPHANLAYKHILTDTCHLSAFPLSIEELTNFSVVYENGDNFTTDYIIESDINIYENETDNILLKESKQPIVEKKIFFHDKFEILKDLQKDSETTLNENRENREIEQRNLLEENNEITWNYNFSYIFKCRVDTINKINVYYINSFNGNISQFSDIIKKCGELFDTNNYPVTLISNLNGGGYGYLSELLLEILSPYVNAKIYNSIRKTNYLFKLIEYSEDNIPWADDCKMKSLKKLFEEGKTINYGNNINDTISGLFFFDGSEVREEFNLIKEKLKNKRKPNDIIVIADGFSYSATSLFLKYLQYYGGGITVGIFPHPNKANIPFDSSLSPSAIFANETLNKLSINYRILHDNYNLIMQMAGIQSFYNPYNLSIPLEYLITPVDEIEPLYEYFSNDTYEKYIQIAKKKLEKYKTQCNPENKILVKISSECDKSFDNEYTHGGYECGKDGKWSSKCVPSYCDIGYYFDPKKGKCSIDYCSKRQSYTSSIFIFITIISLSLSIVVIIIFTIILIYKNKNIKNINSDYEDISKISLSIQDRDDIK